MLHPTLKPILNPTTRRTLAALGVLGASALGTACPRVPEELEPPTQRRIATVELGEPRVQPDAHVAARTPTLFEQEVLAPTEDDAHNEEVGDALLALGKTADAITAFRMALSNGATASVWQKLGDAYVAAGDGARGKRCLMEALALDPGALAARRSLAKLALDDNDGKTARVLAEDVVRAAPDDVQGHRLLGRAYLQLAMWKEAIREMEAVLAHKPDDPYAHNNLGYAALQIGALEKARDHLERCLSLEPQHGYMLNNLGVAYERLGRRAEAHAAFSRAAELNPRYSQAAVNRQRLAGALSDEERVESAETLVSLRSPPADGGGEPASVQGALVDPSDDGIDDALDDALDDDGAAGAGGGSARLAPTP